MQYENDVTITYDARRKGVLVGHAEHLRYLPGPFATEKEAVKAGELFCQKIGWFSPETKKKKKRGL